MIKFNDIFIFLFIFSFGTSYAVKDILNLNIIWIDPAILISVPILIALNRTKTIYFHKGSLIILFLATMSVVSGQLLRLYHYFTGEGFLDYGMLREYIKILGGLIIFTLLINLYSLSGGKIKKYIALSVILHFVIAIFLWFVAMGILPSSGNLGAWAVSYGNWQNLWIGDFKLVRLGGLFPESPPFGLYMFGSFIMLKFCSFSNTFLTKLGTNLAFMGSILSFSDQILIAVFVIVLYIYRKKIISLISKRNPLFFIIATFGILALPLFSFGILGSVSNKISEIGSSESIYRMSGAERAFHTFYSLSILENNPFSLLFGIGPGQYGYYAEKTRLFPSTVNIQVFPVEIVLEYGMIMLLSAIILFTQHAKYIKGQQIIMIIAILAAVLFQANWKWPIIFAVMSHITMNIKEEM